MLLKRIIIQEDYLKLRRIIKYGESMCFCCDMYVKGDSYSYRVCGPRLSILCAVSNNNLTGYSYVYVAEKKI